MSAPLSGLRPLARPEDVGGRAARGAARSARTPAQGYEQRLSSWGVSDRLRPTFVAYLERLHATHAPSTVSGRATELAYFGRHLAEVDPGLTSVADLDRQRHIESYLTATAQATRQVDGAPISIEERRHRIIAVHCFLNDIGQWGWKAAPDRRLIFPRDTPRRPQPLPRYLPADVDRRLSEALSRSTETLAANALLLCRATGLRIGELVDLELDCVHEVPRQGAWLKVPLGKLATERMVPLDDQAVAIVDRIVSVRSPGRPLPHPRDGRLVDFLLTHHGRRVTDYALRGTLQRAAEAAGIAPVTPHQLRHTYATALVNAGVSLQALMALLGHSSAAMSLRYGRLFDATVRADYERALTLAKERLGHVLPDTPTSAPAGDWRELPLIKSRMAGGYCLRTAAQGVCAYTNICEHCPNYRSEPGMLAVLSVQRVDAQALAEDARRRGWDDEATRHAHSRIGLTQSSLRPTPHERVGSSGSVVREPPILAASGFGRGETPKKQGATDLSPSRERRTIDVTKTVGFGGSAGGGLPERITCENDRDASARDRGAGAARPHRRVRRRRGRPSQEHGLSRHRPWRRAASRRWSDPRCQGPQAGKRQARRLD